MHQSSDPQALLEIRTHVLRAIQKYAGNIKTSTHAARDGEVGPIIGMAIL